MADVNCEQAREFSSSDHSCNSEDGSRSTIDEPTNCDDLDNNEGGESSIVTSFTLSVASIFLFIVLGVVLGTMAFKNSANEMEASAVSSSARNTTMSDDHHATSNDDHASGSVETRSNESRVESSSHSKKKLAGLGMLAGGVGTAVGAVGLGVTSHGLLQANNVPSDSAPLPQTNNVPSESESQNTIPDTSTGNSSLLRKTAGGGGSTEWTPGFKGVEIGQEDWSNIMEDQTNNAWVVIIYNPAVAGMGGSGCPLERNQFAWWDQTLPNMVQRYQDPDSKDYNPRVKFALLDYRTAGSHPGLSKGNGRMLPDHQFLAAGTDKTISGFLKYPEAAKELRGSAFPQVNISSQGPGELETLLSEALDAQVKNLPAPVADARGDAGISGDRGDQPTSCCGRAMTNAPFIAFLVLLVVSLALLLVSAVAYFSAE